MKVELDLVVEDPSVSAMDKLAEITGIQEDDPEERFRKLVKDALNVYQWIIAKQSRREIIMSISEEDFMKLAKENRDLLLKQDILAHYVPREKMSLADEHFRTTAERIKSEKGK